MPREILGIDLGSSNTRIYSSLTGGVVFSEPTCIAFDTNTNAVKEVGFLAKKIEGRAPYNYRVVSPVENGLVSDIDAATKYLETILLDLRLNRQFRSVTLVFSAPSHCSKVNQGALIEIGKRLQAREIYIESQAKLGALGAGENVYSPNATLVTNIGAGVSDIACISMGETVSSASSFFAGNTFDESIRRYLQQEEHLAVGSKSAEALKKKIGNVSESGENILSEIKGRDTLTSLPSSAVISSSSLKEVLLPEARFLALKITDVIASLPPELASDLVRNGMLLTGGGALLTGLKDYFQKTLSLIVRTDKEPDSAVVKGLGVYITNLLNA